MGNGKMRVDGDRIHVIIISLGVHNESRRKKNWKYTTKMTRATTSRRKTLGKSKATSKVRRAYLEGNPRSLLRLGLRALGESRRVGDRERKEAPVVDAVAPAAAGAEYRPSATFIGTIDTPPLADADAVDAEGDVRSP
jgi:hypothetical protein